jgi:RNA polymerase sigma factor (sigma-70 family)
VKRYTAQIFALCLAHVPWQEAEDLVQEAFCRALDKLASLREPEKFGSWLYGIARNLCRDWCNDRNNHHKPLPTEADLPVAREPAGEDDRLAALKRCIDRLPEKLREVVVIYYLGGVTYQQLADRLGVSFSQVNKWLTQARKLLRKCLERGDE